MLTVQITMNRLLSVKVKMRFLHLSVHYEQKYTYSVFQHFYLG